MSSKEQKRVAVIGSGIAGLVTAKVLLHDGFDVVVFEKEDALGGTWAPARGYPGLRTNNSKYTYAFSDYPYPAEVDAFPVADDVRDYLNGYADHFHIHERIRFNSRVVTINTGGESGEQFQLTVASGKEQADVEILAFDFVAVCNGVFHEPYIPKYEGMDEFSGRVIPSCDATTEIYNACKHPVVVGGGKSGLDSATAAAQLGLMPTLVVRRPIWIAPRFVGGLIPGDFLVLTRMSSRLLRYHHLRGIEKFLHGAGRVIPKVFWQTFSFIFRKVLGMPPDLTPIPLPKGLDQIGVGGEFFVELNAGRAVAKRGIVKRFEKDHIELEDGTRIPADLVIFATGWEQNLTFLSDEIRDDVRRDGRFYLYRHILPPRVRGMGFIGYSSSVAAQLTAEIGAHWLSQHFLGALDLPSEEDMDSAIERVHAWVAKDMSYRKEGFFVGANVPQYIDDLLGDMDIRTRRMPDFIRENFGPIFPSRFASVGDERRAKREGRIVPKPFYFSAWYAGATAIVLWLVI